MSENAVVNAARSSGDGNQDPPVPTDEEVVNLTQPDTVIRLQTEFVQKLGAWAKEARLLRNESDKLATIGVLSPSNPSWREAVLRSRALRSRVTKVRPAIVDLVRYASGLIENTRLKPITKLELRLRNAECEAALDAISEAIRDLPK